MYRMSRYLSRTSHRLLLLNEHGERSSMLLFRRRMAADPAVDPEEEYYKYVKSRRKFWVKVGVTMLTVGAIAYAKQDPNFRRLIACNIPYSNEFLTVIYQEEYTIAEWAMIQYKYAVDSIHESLFGKELPPPECPVLTEEPNKPPPQEINYCTERDYVAPEPEPEPEPEPPGVDVPETSNFMELDKWLQEYTKEALDSYENSSEQVAAYDKYLMRTIEGYITDLDMTRFDTLRQVQEERDQSVEAAQEVGKYDEKVVEELAKRLSGEVPGPPAQVAEWNSKLDKFRTDIKAAEQQLKDRLEASCVADLYWKKVVKARDSYYVGIEALLPGVVVAKGKLNFEGAETDYLLVHTLRQVSYLQTQLEEIQTLRNHRLNRAIEARENREDILKKIQESFLKRKSEVVAELKAQSDIEKQELNQRMKDQLKDQMEAQQEIIQQKLDSKEKEMTSKFDSMVSERVEKERKEFKQELEKALEQLRNIEADLKERSQAEAAARRAQSLWNAGESLLAATKQSSKPIAMIAKELTAVEKAGADDPLVKTMLKGVSKEAREEGVLTETALRERYFKMESVALKVSLVEKDGAPLPVYFLSWLQSIFLFSRVAAIPERELLDEEPTGSTRMDSYDILQRARYWIERNDIAAALKYVGLLQGASKVAAATWCDAATRHIEIKHAAEAVKTHAVAAALLYV